MTDKDYTEDLVDKYLGEEIKSVCKKHVDNLQISEYDEDGLLKLCEHEFSQLRRTIYRDVRKIVNNYNLDLPLLQVSNPAHAIMHHVYAKFCNDWLDYVIEDYIKYTLREFISVQF